MTYHELFSGIDTQHRTAVRVSQGTLLVRFALFPQLNGRPDDFSVSIIFVVEITFSGAIVGGVESFSVEAAVVDATSVGEIRAENEYLAYSSEGELQEPL